MNNDNSDYEYVKGYAIYKNGKFLEFVNSDKEEFLKEVESLIKDAYRDTLWLWTEHTAAAREMQRMCWYSWRTIEQICEALGVTHDKHYCAAVSKIIRRINGDTPNKFKDGKALHLVPLTFEEKWKTIDNPEESKTYFSKFIMA